MSKKNKLTVAERIANAVEIPVDMAMSLPYIKMCSNREIVIEDAGKLIHYDGECVKVCQRNMRVTVCGRELKIKCLANNDIRVMGFILSVMFE